MCPITGAFATALRKRKRASAESWKTSCFNAYESVCVCVREEEEEGGGGGETASRHVQHARAHTRMRAHTHTYLRQLKHVEHKLAIIGEKCVEGVHGK